ncbi:YciI family protein [Gemmobacter denitrificans]|uniref:YciI family protein n=1 Tax=Gemmobacter denitrificans TaxID=3123040 RepID=A0ABU8BPZ5_9RHOB
MKYMVLLYGNPADDPVPGTPEFEPWMEEFMTLDKRMAHFAMVLSGEGLQGVETATCLKMRNGKVETMDGPFAESREHLGGYYLIEAASLHDAQAFAAAIPIARTGTVEIRPVMDYS